MASFVLLRYCWAVLRSLARFYFVAEAGTMSSNERRLQLPQATFVLDKEKSDEGYSLHFSLRECHE